MTDVTVMPRVVSRCERSLSPPPGAPVNYVDQGGLRWTRQLFRSTGVSVRSQDASVDWRSGSLGCGLLLAVALVVFAVRNLGFLVLGLAGLAVAVGGLWWAVTEQMPRRGVGIAGGVVGVTLIVLAIIWVTPHCRSTTPPPCGTGPVLGRCRWLGESCARA